MGWFSRKNDKDFFLATVPAESRVAEYLGVVSGEAVIGANIFRDMFARWRSCR